MLQVSDHHRCKLVSGTGSGRCPFKSAEGLGVVWEQTQPMLLLCRVWGLAVFWDMYTCGFGFGAAL